MGGFYLKYTFVKNYRDNNTLRSSFNNLTEKTYNFNFIEWYNNGFWTEKYIPYSLADGEKIIANVSVNLMSFKMDGVEKNYIQIGTVMTDEEYRGQGLSRYLMENIIEEYKDKVDGIYLFANDSVLNFYPRFGFVEGREYQYSKYINAADSKIQIEKVDISDKLNREKFLAAAKNSVSNERFSLNNFGLIAFWATGPMSNLIYYIPNEDAYVIGEIKNENLYIHQVIASRKVNLGNVISSFGSDIIKVILGFTPYNAEGYDVEEFHEEDCTLFYLGKDLENIKKKQLIFPTLSHA
jgi:predicted GNAT family N-acyltransferase